jgi:hypothetical protein
MMHFEVLPIIAIFGGQMCKRGRPLCTPAIQIHKALSKSDL